MTLTYVCNFILAKIYNICYITKWNSVTDTSVDNKSVTTN